MKQKHIKNFKEWLARNGAEVLAPTNPYELVRFKANDNIGIIYTGKRGNTCTGEAIEAVDCFFNAKSWRGGNKGTRRLSVDVRTLLERDGNLCFYCLQPLKDDITREHLLSVTHGGKNHVSNLVLCHGKCNIRADSLSLMEKIRLRERAVVAEAIKNYERSRRSDGAVRKETRDDKASQVGSNKSSSES